MQWAMVIRLIWEALKIIGVAYFGWELVKTGSGEKLATAVGNVGEAAGSTAKAVTETTEKLSGGALLVVVIVALIFLRR